eukprot:10403473-Ditylum_brightwellii.AAC.1
MMHGTGAKQVTNTVRFHHHNAVLPQVTQKDRITKATLELQSAIQDTPKNAPPTYVEAVQRLRQVFEAAAKGTKSNAAPPNNSQQSTTQSVAPNQPPVNNTPSPPTKSSIPVVSDDECSDSKESDNECWQAPMSSLIIHHHHDTIYVCRLPMLLIL